MPRTIAASLALAVILLAVGAAAPLEELPGGAALAPAEAAVSKSLASGGGAGGSVGGAGHRFSELLSGWAVPVLTVLAGCLLIGTLLGRNIGASIGIVVITLIGLIFLLSPQTIEALAKGIAHAVF